MTIIARINQKYLSLYGWNILYDYCYDCDDHHCKYNVEYIKCYESTERSNKTLVESGSIVNRITQSLRIASFSTITWFIWYFIWFFLQFSPILLLLSLLLLRLFYRLSSFFILLFVIINDLCRMFHYIYASRTSDSAKVQTAFWKFPTCSIYCRLTSWLAVSLTS